MGILNSSRYFDWAVIEWSETHGINGSLGGSISTRKSLLSVNHRRLLAPEALGFPRGSRFMAFEQQDDAEFLLVSVPLERGWDDQRVELDKLDLMVKSRARREE